MSTTTDQLRRIKRVLRRSTIDIVPEARQSTERQGWSPRQFPSLSICGRRLCTPRKCGKLAHARCCEIHSAWPSRRAQKAANDSNPPRFGSQHEEPAPFATCPKRGALRLCRLFLSSLTPRVVADRYQRHGCWVSKRAERTSVPNSGGLL
jgi:hypothetical protein